MFFLKKKKEECSICFGIHRLKKCKTCAKEKICKRCICSSKICTDCHKKQDEYEWKLQLYIEKTRDDFLDKFRFSESRKYGVSFYENKSLKWYEYY